MNSLRFGDWLSQLERCISESIRGCTPRAWNEDYISYYWLSKVVRDFSEVTLVDLPVPYSVAWDAYKADGPLEENNGDVAVLVKISFKGGSSTTGVGFLEAKRSYENRGYEALSWAQLEWHSSRVANHRLLIYDHQRMDRFSANLLGQAYCQACFPDPYNSVHAVVIPTPHVLALRSRSRELHEIGIPLAYQLCCRYLRGFDLDYSSVLVSAVENGVADGIKYLMLAHVVMDPEGHPSLETFKINREHYRAMFPDSEASHREPHV